MTRDQYREIVEAYNTLRAHRCVQSNNTNGGHYVLALKLGLAGISTRGLSKGELEGEAIRVIGLYAREFNLVQDV